MSFTETKVVKQNKPKTASHPPYFQMIKEALLGLNEKGGSSLYAIAKFMEDKHKPVLPENFRRMLALQLKNSVTKGKLTKVKASYKLGKKVKASAVKKPSKSKRHAVRATATTTVVATKKVTKKPTKKAKKMTPKKQPKSVVAKKARKATV